MAQIVRVDETNCLEEYSEHAPLARAIELLRAEAAQRVASLRGRTVWMINSTPRGGGVAEMLPKQVALLRSLGVQAEWAVLTSDDPAFFDLTKRIHNMIHGVPVRRDLTAADRALLESVGRQNAERLAPRIGPNDIVVVHDPQPLAVAACLKRWRAVRTVWRCHIGLADRVPVTRSVWRFLRDFLGSYDRVVFTAPDYIPGFLRDRAVVLRPAIDPLSDKNRSLSTHRLVGILCNARLGVAHTPILTPPFETPAMRLLSDGQWAPADAQGDLGFLTRPIVTQISRWDRLKGFAPLLDAFVTLKARAAGERDPVRRRRLELLRLVLAGPDPESVADDPEGRDVLEELTAKYRRLDPRLQDDVALLTLPMGSRRENALMVNALQRCSTVVVQNSVQEGFGLTATEAMWKGAPLVASGAYGLRQQIRDGVEGRIVDDPYDTDLLATVLAQVLGDRPAREQLARSAQRRVYEEFLVLAKVRSWLRILDECVALPSSAPATAHDDDESSESRVAC